MTLNEEALEYHSRKPAGKMEIVPTKPCSTQHDLALAYTPGVAEPCRHIQRNPDDAFLYTNRGNLVAVITNGTAVLGLGDIGPLAGKPVMEGKGLLFKRFADIDAVDLELDTHDPEAFMAAVKLMEPSFGGINLEDIKAPECFEIERRLRAEMNIPVFHDDQHGTAIISGAALLNALEIVGKPLDAVKIVFSGAGAAAIATAEFYVTLGARRENIVFADTKGVLYKGRTEGMNPVKEQWAVETDARTLADLLAGADVFVGLSGPNLVTREMLCSMAERPIVFALANPDPEITYEEAKAARPDVLMATGRSDYPNQVNNVLGFPFIFRGALDVRATGVNSAMEVAAAHALADLTRADVPDSVVKAYGLETLRFGPDYLIPKPLDPRVLLWVAPAVAKAAIESGVARLTLDMQEYREQLEARLGTSRELMRIIFNKARANPKRIVLAEGENGKIVRAACHLREEGLAKAVLVGNPKVIHGIAEGLGCCLEGVEIVDPTDEATRAGFAKRIFELRCRKGVTETEAHKMAANPNYAAAVMVEDGRTDGMVTGLSFHYPDALRPPLQIVRIHPGSGTAAGVYLLTTRNRVLFFADTTVNIDPDADTLARIALLTAQLARDFDIEPRVALLSFSNFGSTRHPRAEAVRRAVEIIRQRDPDLIVDGEMQANTALSDEFLKGTYSFSRLNAEANVLIFPNLDAGNIGYKLVQRLANAEIVGPILVGMNKPVYVLQRGDEVKDIVTAAAVAVVQAQNLRAQSEKESAPWQTEEYPLETAASLTSRVSSA